MSRPTAGHAAVHRHASLHGAGRAERDVRLQPGLRARGGLLTTSWILDVPGALSPRHAINVFYAARIAVFQCPDDGQIGTYVTSGATPPASGARRPTRARVPPSAAFTPTACSPWTAGRRFLGTCRRTGTSTTFAFGEKVHGDYYTDAITANARRRRATSSPTAGRWPGWAAPLAPDRTATPSETATTMNTGPASAGPAPSIR